MVGLGLVILLGLGFGAAIFDFGDDPENGENSRDNGQDGADPQLEFISLVDDDFNEGIDSGDGDDETGNDVDGGEDDVEGETDGDADGDTDDGTSEPEEVVELPYEIVHGERVYSVAPAAQLNGSDERDKFYLDDEFTADQFTDPVVIDAGAGDDFIRINALKSTIPLASTQIYSILDGTDGSGIVEMDGGQISGGDGHDRIFVSMANSQIDGGAGDDTIVNRFADGSVINGGDGNDVITAVTQEGGDVTINSGSGNYNAIWASVAGGTIVSGESSDVITTYATHHAPGEEASVLTVYGGGGGDFVGHQAVATPDVNEIVIYLGDGVVPSWAAEFILDYSEGVLDGITYTEPAAGEDPYTVKIATIADFEPGLTPLQLAPSISNDGASVTGVVLKEDTGADTTDVVTTYELDGQPIREVVITLNAVDVTTSDLSFVPHHDPSLYSNASITLA